MAKAAIAPTFFQVSGPDLLLRQPKQQFLNWISRLWFAWPIKEFYAIPESVPVTSLRLAAASAECYGPKLVMVAVVGLPQRQLGKVTRSINVYWMAGILVVYHSTVKIPVDRLIMELCNSCSLGEYCRRLATKPNGMCERSIIFLRLTGTDGTTLAHRVFLWSLVSLCGISI